MFSDLIYASRNTWKKPHFLEPKSFFGANERTVFLQVQWLHLSNACSHISAVYGV